MSSTTTLMCASFFSKAVDAWKDFPGKITYTFIDATPDDDPRYSAYNPRNNWNVIYKDWFTIPYDKMDMVGLDEYQVLASREDSSIEEMYERALKRINTYFKQIHQAYNKPIAIGDLVCGAYKGVLKEPPINDQHAMTRPRDDNAQIKIL